MRAQSDKQSEAVHNNINNNIIEILKLSDKITVSTKHLKESFSVYNKNIVIYRLQVVVGGYFFAWTVDRNPHWQQE